MEPRRRLEKVPPAEDLQLVAEHGILEIQLIEAAADEQAEQARNRHRMDQSIR